MLKLNIAPKRENRLTTKHFFNLHFSKKSISVNIFIYECSLFQSKNVCIYISFLIRASKWFEVVPALFCCSFHISHNLWNLISFPKGQLYNRFVCLYLPLSLISLDIFCFHSLSLFPSLSISLSLSLSLSLSHTLFLSLSLSNASLFVCLSVCLDIGMD